MGIISRQSIQNSLFIYAGFVLGGVNTLFLYTHFLEKNYYGLVIFLLSTANLLVPFIAFSVQNILIKFFYDYSQKTQRDSFLVFLIFLPLFLALPIGFLGAVFYEKISFYLSFKNPLIREYVFLIYFFSIFICYFELFYAWVKVHFKSVFGNFLKEVFLRLSVIFFLILLAFKMISEKNFIYFLCFSSFLRMLLMVFYALKIYKPSWQFTFPKNIKKILKYAFYLSLASFSGSFLLELDKFMIPQKQELIQVAYYAVAVYIASVIEVPQRAMNQILYPLVSKAISEKNKRMLKVLHKKTAIHILLFAGGIFIFIMANVKDIYSFTGKGYDFATNVVFLIGFSKIFHAISGVSGAMITNSKYYKMLLPYSVLMALFVIVGNYFLIDLWGIFGAAVSTFLTILIFNIVKILYVYKKFKVQPFSKKLFKITFIVLVFYMLFSQLKFPFSPLVNISLKTLFIILNYGFVVYFMKISREFNKIVKKYFINPLHLF